MTTELETSFAAALLDPRSAPPPGLSCRPGADAERRFAIYRTNVIAALIRALEQRFPASRRIVGDAFFRAMAAGFVRRYPPRSPVLLHYGAELPDYVARFEPASSLPYLPDLMRLELALAESFHAEDVHPAESDALASLGPGAPVLVRLHPAVRLLRSDHPIGTLWSMNREGGELGPIESWGGEDVLVTRPGLRVAIHVLSAGTCAFLEALADGTPLEAALGRGLEAAPEFDPAGALALLIRTGAAAAFTSQPPRNEESLP